jgi:glycine cleavage system H protein
MVQVGDEVGMIETVKASLGLLSPVEGMVVQVNPLLESTPEVINQDPYGDGWLVVIEVADWDLQKSRLLAADAYFVQMKQQAEDEAKAT